MSTFDLGQYNDVVIFRTSDCEPDELQCAKANEVVRSFVKPSIDDSDLRRTKVLVP